MFSFKVLTAFRISRPSIISVAVTAVSARPFTICDVPPPSSSNLIRLSIDSPAFCPITSVSSLSPSSIDVSS
uniref:Uncharacterized protein n=1 Tax=uncultured marine virus TaxID=186617 RepID=A0A0F7L998_9VIRU|nr:hypothetical protein [uncultured marine virus]